MRLGALHDVDQIPTNPENSYPYPEKRPVHACVSTKQNSNFQYVIVGGVLLNGLLPEHGWTEALVRDSIHAEPRTQAQQ